MTNDSQSPTHRRGPSLRRLSVLLVPALSLVGCRVSSAARSERAVAPAAASWTVDAARIHESGLRSLSGADGVTAVVERGGARCLTTQDGTTPASQYLYFQAAAPPAAPVFVTVEYFDAQPGGMLNLEYDSDAGEDLASAYHPAENRAGGLYSGGMKWRKAIFEVQHPRFAHRENLGADFRFTGARMYLRAVRLSARRPADWNGVGRMTVKDLKPLVKIGPGGQLIVGGFDPARVSDAIPQSQALEAAVPGLEQLGVTSHEGYVRWNLCEPVDGQYDWSVYDRFVQVYRRHHLKWVPFLIVGSAYSLPDWYYKKPGSQGYVCLEHGQESDVQSLWNPVLRDHVARFLKAFCDHYRDTGVIESILLGITGNYGEAIYPASGNDWTADIHGPYHTHAGYWAGDPFARADFRKWVSQKYGDAGRLSLAWGKKIASFDDVQPFLRKDAPDDRAWLDFTDWYIGSMTNWARFWLTETRKNFPKGDIYLCTGGHAPPEHGSDFEEQCKAAAEVHGGVRITNEGSDYRANFSLTHWVASAGEQYGAYYSFEPAGGVDANGVIARIYNATASGARGLHYYYPNLFGAEDARQNFLRWGGQFLQRHPVVEIGVYYPETYIRLHGNDFLPRLQQLRDRFDFNPVSDGQIADGGLNRVRALILLEGSIAEAGTWQRMQDWVKGGGLLLTADGIGRLQTVEGDTSAQDTLFGAGADHGRGRVVTFSGNPDSNEYRDFLCRTLTHAPELSAGTRAMVTADGQDDGVFVTLTAPDQLLWLNYAAAAVQKTLPAPLTLPPYSIVAQHL